MKQLKDLKQEILSNKLNNFYVFYGEDFGLRKHYIDAIGKHYDKIIVVDDYLGLSNESGDILFKSSTLYILYDCVDFYKNTEEQINNFIRKIGDDCVIFDSDEPYEKTTLFKSFGQYITYFPLVSDAIGIQFVESEVSLIQSSKKQLAYNNYNNYSQILFDTDKIKSYSQEKQISQQQAYEVLLANKQLNMRYEEYNNDLIVNDILTNNYKKFAYWANLIREKYTDEFWYNMTRTINDFLIAYFIMKNGMYDGGTKAYNLGLPWYRIKVIRELIIAYDSDSLLYYASALANLDFLLKTGKIKVEDIFDYIIYILM